MFLSGSTTKKSRGKKGETSGNTLNSWLIKSNTKTSNELMEIDDRKFIYSTCCLFYSSYSMH